MSSSGSARRHGHAGGLQAQVDAAAAKLWGIDGPELAAIHQALEDMKKVKPAAKDADKDTEEAEEE